MKNQSQRKRLFFRQASGTKGAIKMSQSHTGTLTIEPITNEETNRPANYTQEDLRLSLLHSGVCTTNKSNTIIMKLTDEPIRFWNSATVILWYVLAGSSNSSWGTWIYKYRTMQTGQQIESNRSIRNKKQPSLYLCLSACPSLSPFLSFSSLSLSLFLSLSLSLYLSHRHTHTPLLAEILGCIWQSCPLRQLSYLPLVTPQFVLQSPGILVWSFYSWSGCWSIPLGKPRKDHSVQTTKSRVQKIQQCIQFFSQTLYFKLKQLVFYYRLTIT